MYVTYNGYTHSNYENWFRIESRFRKSGLGLPQSILNRWTIFGTLKSESGSATELTTAMANLSAAYSDDGGDLAIYENDGTTLTNHVLLNDFTVNGVRVVKFDWLDRDPRHGQPGCEYVNRRTYRIILEGETVDDDRSGIIEWEETIYARGNGGQKFILKPALTGLPQKQILQQRTPIVTIQRGRAIGYESYPVPATPIWSQHLHSDRVSPLLRTPKFGAVRNTEFPIEWEYRYTSNTPLVGGPTLV